MVVGEIPESVDLLVVGGGPGGYAAALEAGRLGRNVVLVDAEGPEGLGGICVRVGCIPSKALIELASHTHARAAWAQRGAPEPSEGRVDLSRFQAWKQEVVGGLNGGLQGLLNQAGVDVRRGWFRFTRPDQGSLVTHPNSPPTHLQFASAIIASGSRPAELPSLPFDDQRVVSSTEVLDLAELPESIAVVGGGYIGLELGTALAKLGVAVTIVESQDRVLPTMERAVGALLAKQLHRLGVRLITGATEVRDDGTTLRLQTAQESLDLNVDLVVVAVGRVPNTDDLGLEALRVSPDERGLLPVGPDRLLTPRVAAIGDITAGPALAHKAMAEGLVAAGTLSGQRRSFDPSAIPAVVFSDPEVAQSGLTVAEAEEAGHAARTARFPVSASGRARTLGETQGFTEYVVDKTTGIVLGATIVGPFASELIAEATLAVEMSAHLEDLAGTIHAHPTLSEMHQETSMVGLGTPLHVPGKHVHEQ